MKKLNCCGAIIFWHMVGGGRLAREGGTWLYL